MCAWPLCMAWSCDHRFDVVRDIKLRCGVYGCDREPRLCVTYYGLGIGDAPMFIIAGACRRRRRRLTKRARLQIPAGWPPPPRSRPRRSSRMVLLRRRPVQCLRRLGRHHERRRLDHRFHRGDEPQRSIGADLRGSALWALLVHVGKANPVTTAKTARYGQLKPR